MYNDNCPDDTYLPQYTCPEAVLDYTTISLFDFDQDGGDGSDGGLTRESFDYGAVNGNILTYRVTTTTEVGAIVGDSALYGKFVRGRSTVFGVESIPNLNTYTTPQCCGQCSQSPCLGNAPAWPSGECCKKLPYSCISGNNWDNSASQYLVRDILTSSTCDDGNPGDVDILTQQQQDRAIAFTIFNSSATGIRFETNKSSTYIGTDQELNSRNFLIAGASPLETVCPSPPSSPPPPESPPPLDVVPPFPPPFPPPSPPPPDFDPQLQGKSKTKFWKALASSNFS